MPTTKILTPYRVADSLELRPSDTRLPPNDERGLEIVWPTRTTDEEPLTLDLTQVRAHDWTELSFTLDSTIPPPDLEWVLPSEASLSDDVTMVVSIHCTATKFHEAIVLPFLSDRRWRGDVHIAKENVAGTVTIKAQLVRRTSSLNQTGDAQRATEAGQIVAEGQGLQILFDHRPGLSRGVIDTRWRDFRNQGDDWEREHYTDLYHLDLERSDPVLWLNSHYDKFRAAMHERRETGRDAVIRYLGNSSIAQSVWIQIFMSAVMSLEEDESGVVNEPPENWKREALELLATHMFGAQDPSERLHRLFEMKGPDQIDGLLPWVSTVSQHMAKSGQLVKRAIAAAEELPSENGDSER